jgi:3-dehydroquinate synthase
MSQPASLLQLTLQSKAHSYPIVVQAGLLSDLGKHLRQTLPQANKLLLVSDANIAPHWLAQAQAACQAQGWGCHTVILPAGETAKTTDSLHTLLAQADEAGLTRNDALVALGGGVMGDTVGLAAALYYRGCGFVQVPTTLLAMVDSSVGGKVAINGPRVKNSIGAFYHPHAVLMDTDILATLPQREWLAGMAEVAKYALLENAALGGQPVSALPMDKPVLPLWPWLLQHASALQQPPSPSNPHLSTEMVTALLLTCCALKAAVVMRDPDETGGQLDATGRIALNLGHTFGHAYEQTLGYGTLLHGEAVALGLRLAVATSLHLGLLADEEATTVQDGLTALGLGLTWPSLHKAPAETLVAAMSRDKKVRQGKVRLVLPTSPLGCLVIKDDVPSELLVSLFEKQAV